MNSSTNKTVLLLVFTILITISIFMVWFFYLKTPSQNPSKNSLDKTEVNKVRINDSDPRNLQSTDISSQRKYQQDIEVLLQQEGLTKEEKDLLLLRKATSLSSANVVSLEKQDQVEASKILYEMVFSNERPNNFTKSIAVSSLLRMYREWCFDGENLSYLLTDNDYYNKNYKVIAAKYSDHQLATLILFSNFANNYSTLPGLKQDTAFLANSAIINAMILRNYGEKLDSKTREDIYTRLKDNVESFKFATPKTFITFDTGTLGPAVSFAVAQDIALTYNNPNPSKEENQKIDSAYERVFTLMDSTESGDIKAHPLINMVNTSYYYDSLNRRYGINAANKKKSELVDRFLTQAATVTDYKPLMSNFYRDGFYGNSKWEKMKNNFVSASVYHPELKQFFISIGIKDEDIVKYKNDWTKL